MPNTSFKICRVCSHDGLRVAPKNLSLKGTPCLKTRCPKSHIVQSDSEAAALSLAKEQSEAIMPLTLLYKRKAAGGEADVPRLCFLPYSMKTAVFIPLL